MKWATFAILGSTAGLCSANVLNLGQLDQYKGRTSDILNLSGTVIWASGRREDGFEVALSADTQSQVHRVLEGCSGTNSRCFHAVLGVLEAAHLQVDARMEPREFLGRLDATFKTRGSFLAFYASVLESLWADTQQQHQHRRQRRDEALPPRHFFPYAQAGEAALLATAANPVTVRATEVTEWTMTPSTAPTKITLQGLTTPGVTEYSTPTQPLAKDDNVPAPAVTEYIARLDADLAQRIDSALRLPRGDCNDGRQLDAAMLPDDAVLARRRARRSTRNSYGVAVCGAEALAPMVGAGGPFHDLLLVGSDKHNETTARPLAFRVPAAEHAAAAVRGFFGEAAVAAPLGLEPSLASRLGTFLFALAIDVLVEDRVLGAENSIEATVVLGAGEA